MTPKECEVSGGMPCFNPSLLPVENVTQTRISLKCFEIGNVQLVHNMKWTTQEEDVANKKAFLRSLMLHIYAELFTQGCIPSDLKWSYPSAMGDMLVNQYSQIWNNLGVNLCPVVDEQTGTAYPLKVCASDIVASLNFDTAKDGKPQVPKLRMLWVRGMTRIPMLCGVLQTPNRFGAILQWTMAVGAMQLLPTKVGMIPPWNKPVVGMKRQNRRRKSKI